MDHKFNKLKTLTLEILDTTVQHALSSLVCHHFLLSDKYSVTVRGFGSEMCRWRCRQNIHSILVMLCAKNV
jgi:hypothetical protein